MKTMKLGKTDIDISRMGLGTWSIGGGSAWGGDHDLQVVVDTIREAPKLGVNLIDTAPGYNFGNSEKILGKALEGMNREDVVIITKCGVTWDQEMKGDLFNKVNGIQLYKNLNSASIKREMGTAHKVTIDGKSYTPQEISAMILQKLKSDAEAYLGETVTQAVITVPAYFTDAQRQATKDAGKIAGLDVKRIINEPTAAALSYGVDKEKDQKVMVYDLGGGTFDVSIIEMGDGVQEVLATAGNNRLGGDDFDKRIIDWMVASFKTETGIDLSQDKVAMQRLKEAAEKSKIELSGVTTSNINLPFITADQTGPKHLDLTLTRAKFDELTSDLVEATMGPVRSALQDSGLQIGQIDKVLMVGGSSRIPAVQDAVKKLIGKEPREGQSAHGNRLRFPQLTVTHTRTCRF